MNAVAAVLIILAAQVFQVQDPPADQHRAAADATDEGKIPSVLWPGRRCSRYLVLIRAMAVQYAGLA